MKHLKDILYSLVAVVAALSFTACSEDLSSVAGRWEVTSTDICDVHTDYATGQGDIYLFESGGTYTISDPSGKTVAQGEWEYNDANGTLTLWSDPEANVGGTYYVDQLDAYTMLLSFDFGFTYGEIKMARRPKTNSRD